MPRTGRRARSLPSQRQASLAPREMLEVASAIRAPTMKTTPMTARIADLRADRQHALDVAAGEGELAHRVEADTERQRRHHQSGHRADARAAGS